MAVIDRIHQHIDTRSDKLWVKYQIFTPEGLAAPGPEGFSGWVGDTR